MSRNRCFKAGNFRVSRVVATSALESLAGHAIALHLIKTYHSSHRCLSTLGKANSASLTHRLRLTEKARARCSHNHQQHLLDHHLHILPTNRLRLQETHREAVRSSEAHIMQPTILSVIAIHPADVGEDSPFLRAAHHPRRTMRMWTRMV